MFKASDITPATLYQIATLLLVGFAGAGRAAKRAGKEYRGKNISLNFLILTKQEAIRKPQKIIVLLLMTGH